MRKTILLTSLIFLMPLVAKAAPLKIVNVGRAGNQLRLQHVVFSSS